MFSRIYFFYSIGDKVSTLFFKKNSAYNFTPFRSGCQGAKVRQGHVRSAWKFLWEFRGPSIVPATSIKFPGAIPNFWDFGGRVRVSTLFFKKKIVLIILLFSGPVTNRQKWVKELSDWLEIFCASSGGQLLYPRTVSSFLCKYRKIRFFDWSFFEKKCAYVIFGKIQVKNKKHPNRLVTKIY